MRLKQAVVINLPRREDRLAAFRERWATAGQPLPVAVHPAIDGQGLVLPEVWQAAGAASYGQYLSHLSALAQGEGPMLVLEDDVAFLRNARDLLRELPEPPGPWDLLYLGGELVRPHPPVPQAPQQALISAPRGVRGVFAYVVRNPAALAERLRLRQDWGLRLDDVLMTGRLLAYAYAPFAVETEEA